MALINLLAKFKAKETTPENFFALEINEDLVKSAVWAVIDGHTKLIKLGPSKTWNGQDQAQLLTAVDKSISQASENLKPEPQGVIFGLPESWLDNENINPEKKGLLKFICQELTLKPLGFVATNTAVIQALKIDEGSPPSAIFIELRASDLTLSLVKLGKVVGSEIVGRSDDLGKDVEEGLSRFKNVDTLPARMLLYDGDSDFEEDKQQLISYDWEEKLPFIHFPKVESLPGETSIKAIALSGGSEVAKSLGFEIKTQPKREPVPSAAEGVERAEPDAASLGFVSDEDIAAEPQSEPESSPESPTFPEPSESTVPPEPNRRVKINLDKPIQLIKSIASKISDRLKIFKKTPLFLTAIIAGFVLIFIALFSAYWFLPKARVAIYLEPKTVSEDVNLIIDSKLSEMDLAAAIIPGEVVNISVEGEKSIPTTGTNTIGDPAKGDISIYNKTADTKVFPADTALIGPDNLVFILDEETTVASRSATEDSDGVITITPGKADGKVTAKSIGPEGNLSSGSKLTFKQFSEDDYYAKTSGLSGGTAREVKAVAADDQTELLAALTEELQQQAAGQLSTQLGSDKALVELESNEQNITKNFNHKAGEEADNLKLTAKLAYNALSYNKADLNRLLAEAIKSKIPENYTLGSGLDPKIAPAELDSAGKAELTVALQAALVPKIDFDVIKKNLKGRYPALVNAYLATLPSFVRAEITITPNLPEKLKTLPHSAKNIFIEIKTSP